MINSREETEIWEAQFGAFAYKGAWNRARYHEPGIVPGGYAPALSEIAAAIEGSGLLMTDVEILRLHYARTLRAWRRNFDARRGDVRRIFATDPELTERFGGADRFIRMWDFYLAGFEQFFKYYRLVVFQVQLTKVIDAVPLTRRYIYDPLHSNSAARSLRAAE